MKLKLSLAFVAAMCHFILMAQNGVGINTENPQATLHVQPQIGISNGILFPTVEQFSSTNPTVAQNGMLVFLERNINEGAGFEGFYFWDAQQNTWQYIFQSKMLDANLFTTIIQSPSFSIIPGGSTNTNVWYKSDFTSIQSPDGNYKLQSGDLVIGRTGTYSLYFTGGIYRDASSTTAVSTQVGVFLDNAVNPSFTSQAPIPAPDNGRRSVNHTISEIVHLTKGQILSVKSRRLTNVDQNMGAASTYTLVPINKSQFQREAISVKYRDAHHSEQPVSYHC